MRMRQAIKTKYLPCTNHRPSRIKASCDAGSVCVGWDYGKGCGTNHTDAAYALMQKLDWQGTLVGGFFQGEYYFVIVD